MRLTARATCFSLALSGALLSAPVHGGDTRGNDARTDDTPTGSPFLATLDHPTYFERAAALTHLLERSEVSGLQTYLDETKGIEHIGTRAAWAGMVYARYTQLDPSGAVDHILATDWNDEKTLLYATFCNWADADLEAAIARSMELTRLPNRQIAKQAILAAHSDLDAADLDALSNRLGTPTETNIEAILAQKIERLARSNPRAAMSQAEAITDTDLRQSLLRSIGSFYAARSPDAALADSSRLNDPDAKREFRIGVITELALIDPEALLDELESGIYSQGERNGIVNFVFTDLAGRDPEQGVLLAGQVSPPALRNWALNALFGALPKNDPRYELELLELAGDDAPFLTYGTQALKRLARTDPREALDRALAHRNLAADIVPQILAGIAEADPQQALEWAQALPNPQLRSAANSSVILKVAETDPLLAIDFLAFLPRGLTKNTTLNSVVRQWATRDAPAAIAWVLSQPAPARGQLLMGGWQHTIAANDPELALAVYDQLDSARQRVDWARSFIYPVSNANPRMVANWLNEHPELLEDQQITRGVVNGLAQHDIQDALSYAERLPAGPAQDAALSAVVSQWAARDVTAAAAYVSEIDEPSRLLVLMPEVIRQWSQIDFDAARRWLSLLPHAEVRDQGMSMLVGNAFSYGIDPLPLIDAIDDEQIRRQALGQYVQMLSFQSPAAARDFLARGDLPAGFSEDWLSNNELGVE